MESNQIRAGRDPGDNPGVISSEWERFIEIKTEKTKTETETQSMLVTK